MINQHNINNEMLVNRIFKISGFLTILMLFSCGEKDVEEETNFRINYPDDIQISIR